MRLKNEIPKKTPKIPPIFEIKSDNSIEGCSVIKRYFNSS